MSWLQSTILVISHFPSPRPLVNVVSHCTVCASAGINRIELGGGGSKRGEGVGKGITSVLSTFVGIVDHITSFYSETSISKAAYAQK